MTLEEQIAELQTEQTELRDEVAALREDVSSLKDLERRMRRLEQDDPAEMASMAVRPLLERIEALESLHTWGDGLRTKGFANGTHTRGFRK